jgi:hypothetical protein
LHRAAERARRQARHDGHATIALNNVVQAGQPAVNFVDAAGVLLSRNVRVTVNVLWTQVPGRSRQVSVVTTHN